jgi:hypothetical protein
MADKPDLQNRHVALGAAFGVVAVVAAAAAFGYWQAAASQSEHPLTLWPEWIFGACFFAAVYFLFAAVMPLPPFRRTAPAENGLSILHAEWGAPAASWANVTEVVRERVVNGRLDMWATISDLGDPCPGEGKYLRVTYQTSDCEAHTESVPEPERVVLPPAPQPQTTIHNEIEFKSTGTFTAPGDEPAVSPELEHQESISAPHLEQIKRICQTLSTTVGAGGRPDYHDPKSALRHDPRVRTALEVHCPDVVSACDLWDDVLDQVAEIVDCLIAQIESEVDRRYVSPPWRVEFVGPIVLDGIRAWAHAPNEPIPPIRFIEFDSRTGQAVESGDLALYGSITVLMRKGGLAGAEVQRAQDDLNRFLNIAVTWSDSTHLSALYPEREERRKEAQIEALSVLDRHSLSRNGGCPLC